MLFNSIPFLLFFIGVLIVFFNTPGKFRWVVLLAASYIYYMSWQPGYALLLAFTTIVSFWCGIKSETRNIPIRKLYLSISVVVNLGLLIFFKYFDFLNEIIKDVLNWSTGITYGFDGFGILLPIGISFYTFQTLSYNLDVYYGLKKPEKHLGIFALYVSFFPQLMAGPIERSSSLLPQFYKVNNFNWDRFNIGSKYIIWGLFKKMVISDRLSVYVNMVYNDSGNYHGGALAFATILFAFQLYCDFSAYSDIAKGTAKILGIDLMENFNHPFISKNITEFWRRWHISLSNWLKDYVYTPIVFKHKTWGKVSVLYAIFITFFLCGLWHGVRMSFVVFGLIQGLALMYELLSVDFRKKLKSKVNLKLYNGFSLVLTFIFVIFSFIFFRADDMAHSSEIVSKLFSLNYQFSEIIEILNNGKLRFAFVFLLLIFFILFDIKIFKIVSDQVQVSLNKQRLLFSFLSALIIIFGFYGEVEFIYFQY